MSLENKKVVLAASRKTDEMSTLIQKRGGEAVIRSLQGTVFLNDTQIREDLQKIVQEQFDWMIFTTGMGLNTMLELAEEMELREPLLQMIQQAKTGARGYKTLAALKKIQAAPAAKDEDGTVNGLIEKLEAFDFDGKRVMVQLHGENAPSLIQYLESKGASVMPVLPYKHVDPDLETVETFCQEVMQEEVDAVCFTAAIQVRSLFKYVDEKGYRGKIQEAFQNRPLAVAVGKVTAEALQDEGIERVIQPEHERMGAMIVELSNYYESEQSRR